MNDLIQINPSSLTGKKYWRSLDALAETATFRDWVDREFPEGASEMGGSSRRTLLKLMAAGFGLAGLTACRRPEEHILPHSKGVEGYVHGRPQHYASVVTVGGVASGVTLEANDGRPTKVEGNARHPYSLGATTAHQQGLVLNVYDPDRAKGVERGKAKSSWDEFAAWWKGASEKLGDGAGLRVLAPRSSSPTLEALKAEIAKKYPQSKWHEFESVRRDRVLLGTEMAFGQALEPHYELDKADVVFSLDADFLGLDSETVRPTKLFAQRRKVDGHEAQMNRLYVAESNFTITGAMADHRLRVRSSEAGALVMALAKELNVSGAELKVLGGATDQTKKFVAALAKDLAAKKGKAVVIAGPKQPTAVHAVVALINQTLAAPVTYTKPVVDTKCALKHAEELAADLKSGAVKTLFLLGGNPVYSYPADVKLAEALKGVESVALTFDENETWQAAEWKLPEAHEFESWGDAKALDGTVSIQQPVIEPLYGGKSILELASLIARGEFVKPYQLVKQSWVGQWGADGEKKWTLALHDGFVEGTAAAKVEPKADTAKVLAAAASEIKAGEAGIEVVFYASSGPYDGRFANNAWLHEAPDPMTKLVWDNAALLSAATAKELGTEDGDILTIAANGQTIEMPAMVLPGHADRSISVSLGYGRTSVGRVGRDVGHRAELLRTLKEFHIISSAQVAKKAGAHYQLVTTQEHHTLEEPITKLKRTDIVIERTLEEYVKAPHGEEHHEEKVEDLFAGHDYSKGMQWGMAIDLNSCTGCNACLVACVAENNIPVVGKEQVQKGREMHWIRMDRYFTGSEEDPQAVVQPMACQQCEKAPCESVCPVAATAHSPEGLNEMAYNRCVGTRYCANNCPYKVRRFNFLNWNKDVAETQKMAFNPDVTVRMRGVMEKCNYCVQRIEEKRTLAKSEGRRPIRDLEIQSACQQVCPAEAIVFGNINDPQSRVAKAKQQPRNYIVVEELNTKPRTTYLAKLRNLNPELA